MVRKTSVKRHRRCRSRSGYKRHKCSTVKRHSRKVSSTRKRKVSSKRRPSRTPKRKSTYRRRSTTRKRSAPKRKTSKRTPKRKTKYHCTTKGYPRERYTDAKGRKRSRVRAGCAPVRGCSKRKTSRYTTRKAPAIKASDCKGKNRKGNDGEMYRSKRYVVNGKAQYRWVKARKASKTRKSSKKTRKTSKKAAKRSPVMAGAMVPYVGRASPARQPRIEFPPSASPVRSPLRLGAPARSRSPLIQFSPTPSQREWSLRRDEMMV